MNSITIAIPMLSAQKWEAELAMKILVRFYQTLGKRQKEATLIKILDDGTHIELITKYLRQKSLKENCQIVKTENRLFEQLPLEGPTFVFLPMVNPGSNWIRTAISFGMPVIAMKGARNSIYLDATCSAIFECYEEVDYVVRIADWLEMLVMDPGAQDFLLKGAKKRKLIFKQEAANLLSKVA